MSWIAILTGPWCAFVFLAHFLDYLYSHVPGKELQALNGFIFPSLDTELAFVFLR